MRYQPKTAKLWVWIHRSSQRTTRKAATADTSVPSARRPQSVAAGPGCLSAW